MNFKAVKVLLIAFLVAIPILHIVHAAVAKPSTETILKVMEFPTAFSTNGTPEGWRLQRYIGQPFCRMENNGERPYLRMKSSGSTAFGLSKDVSLDVRNYPFMHWRWKAIQLPQGGDIRRVEQDDQVMQIYVVFPGKGLFNNIMTSPTIAYIWDNEAPKNLMVQSPQKKLRHVRYVVLRNKTDAMGHWQTEKRNLYEDYKMMFKDIDGGEPQGPIQSLLVFINTHHTKSEAEGSIGDMYFSMKGE